METSFDSWVIRTGYLERSGFDRHTFMSSVISQKTKFLHIRNKGADQLCRDCTDDQCLCFCYNDRKIPLLPIYQN